MGRFSENINDISFSHLHLADFVTYSQPKNHQSAGARLGLGLVEHYRRNSTHEHMSVRQIRDKCAEQINAVREAIFKKKTV